MPVTDDRIALGLVDIDRYPLNALASPAGVQLVEQCKAALAKHALCTLPGFLRGDAIQALIDEAVPLIPEAVCTDTERTIFFSKTHDASYPSDHPRNLFFRNRYARIVNHQFRNEGLTRTLFLWPALTEFVRQVFGATTMYPVQCPHLALTAKIEGKGDTDSWHYDGNDGVVSLLLQCADDGGFFEYAPYIRTLENENLEQVGKLLEAPQRYAQRPVLEPGTLVFFNGNLSLHRVTPVGDTSKPRIVVLFSFDREPNLVMSDRAVEGLRALPKVKDSIATQGKYLGCAQQS